MHIKFINMPFADIAIPSIALTQLKSITETVFQDKATVDIHYLNHDFGEYLTLDHYRFISLSGSSNNSGFGEWFFTQAAHPHLPDNTSAYLVRYGSLIGLDYLQKNGAFLQEKRQGLTDYLDTLIDKYNLADADIVGFTTMFMQNNASLAMAQRIKKRNKNVIIIFGGANCETPMGEELVKHYDVIDYAFSGTALVSFPKLLKAIMSGNRSEAEVVNGIFTRNNCMNVVKAKAKVVVTNTGEVETIGPIGDEFSINECVRLDYDSFLESFESFFEGDDVKPYLLFETSRGCWWGAKAHCTFCGLNGGGMSYRAMKDELAVNMLNDLFKRYGDRVKHFSCVDNIIPKEYITGVFPYLEKHPDITMFYEVRADLTPEEMGILSDAGVVEMQPGIESLATSTLKIMKKGTSAFNNIRFLQNTILYSVVPSWNLLVGFPGEDEAVYEKYFNELSLVYHLPPPSGVFPVRFDRYSPYFMQTEKYNLDLHPLDYYEYNYSLPKEALKDMAYYFSDHNYDADYIRITSKWIVKLEKRLKEWKDQWANIDNVKFPKLYFTRENEMDVVVDSRMLPEKRIPLQPEERLVCENLNQKKNITGLLVQMPGYTLEQLTAIVEKMAGYGLLFHENGTYMNLVFDEEPILKRSHKYH